MDPTDSGAASNLVEVPKPVAARIDWIDAAKAVSILLVVFHHSELISGAVGLKWGIYERLDALFGPIRMPLFFTVSGIFAAKAVSQGRAPDRKTSQRSIIDIMLNHGSTAVTCFWDQGSSRPSCPGTTPSGSIAQSER